MENTLGKRIALHRKRLGLTQDALAEQLGITAQAVSKWENDLSCPDIATLPRLAEIFGISTDELLGRQASETVHEAEVVDDDETPGIHFENNDGSWNFHWDAGRKHALVFPFFILLVGGLTLLARILDWDVSFWSILWPCAIVFTGVGGLLHRFSVFNSACVLFGGYYLISNLGLWTLDISGKLFFPICIVLFGVGLLIDAMRKPKKPRIRVTKSGKKIPGVYANKKQVNECTTEGEEFQCSLSFGEHTHVVALPRLSMGEISVSFGELTVDLTGCEEVSQDCEIEASCSFGELRLLVPSRFAVQSSNSTAFASIDVHGQPDAAPAGVIHLDANASFGEISVRYI